VSNVAGYFRCLGNRMFDTADHWIEIRLLSLGTALEFRTPRSNCALYVGEDRTETNAVCVKEGETQLLTARFTQGQSDQREVAFELHSDDMLLGQLLCFATSTGQEQVWTWLGSSTALDVCLERDGETRLSILCVADDCAQLDTCADQVALSVL